jgi:hypothetical protein
MNKSECESNHNNIICHGSIAFWLDCSVLFFKDKQCKSARLGKNKEELNYSIKYPNYKSDSQHHPLLIYENMLLDARDQSIITYESDFDKINVSCIVSLRNSTLIHRNIA